MNYNKAKFIEQFGSDEHFDSLKNSSNDAKHVMACSDRTSPEQLLHLAKDYGSGTGIHVIQSPNATEEHFNAVDHYIVDSAIRHHNIPSVIQNKHLPDKFKDIAYSNIDSAPIALYRKDSTEHNIDVALNVAGRFKVDRPSKFRDIHFAAARHPNTTGEQLHRLYMNGDGWGNHAAIVSHPNVLDKTMSAIIDAHLIHHDDTISAAVNNPNISKENSLRIYAAKEKLKQ